MSRSLAPAPLAPLNGYQLWADTYDQEHNPILSVEQRILESLLPPLRGLDVVDLGCGTGRLLNVSRKAGARTLVGVDISPGMVRVARTKLGDAATLLCAECGNAPIAGASADVIFCSFVLSYLGDAEQLFRFVKTILRPGGSFFLSDVHPETAAALRWRRGVSLKGEFKEIRTHHRTLEEVVALCEKANLELAIQLEPTFGEEERVIFRENGKHKYFESIRERPAIYLLQARSWGKRETNVLRQNERGIAQRIRAGRIALGPSDSVRAEMCILGGC